MDWTQAIDAYCERTGPEFWAEPVNAVTNAAFLVAALVMARRIRGDWPGAGLARALVAILAAIGVGSFLFHTFAVAWASTADVLPIVAFILVYVFVANRYVLGLGQPAALGATALFVPYAALTIPVFAHLPGFEVSAAYWPVPLLIALYAFGLRRRAPATARGLAAGAGILAISLVFRSLDEGVCGALPLGTHFAWHLLNALMLGWMIEVFRRHMLAGDGAGR